MTESPASVPLLSVAEARRRILTAVSPLPTEIVGLDRAFGRVLAEPLHARRTQPPLAVSAMDGYAVRAADLSHAPARLRLVGEVAAGKAYEGRLEAGQALRIFTGAPLPEGADAVVLQEESVEETTTDGTLVLLRESPPPGRYVRPAGLDFQTGEVLLPAGKRLNARDIGLAAAMDHPWLPVFRRPRVAILMTGDELTLPGLPRTAQQIVASNGLALAAAITAAGGIPHQLGIADDDPRQLGRLTEQAAGMDLLVTSGGASVGKHDLVRQTLDAKGLTLDFWRIAMRPGKPLLFGRLGSTPVLGLPGNPVSTLVCALVFLRPALERLSGSSFLGPVRERAYLARDLPANDRREEYLRASLRQDAEGRWLASPFSQQDSSMAAKLAQADCLLIRPPFAPSAVAGSPCEILPLGPTNGGF